MTIDDKVKDTSYLKLLVNISFRLSFTFTISIILIKVFGRRIKEPVSVNVFFYLTIC